MAPKLLRQLFSKTKVYNFSGNVDIDTDVYNADFETAISATKFGKFNILLFLLAMPAGWAAMFENTTMSYVFPAAHCDLELSLNDRGSLNAITFLGMVTSGFIWGFLCDAFGRKRLMVFGYLLDACFVIMSSFAQSLTLLLVFKFLGGFIINGPLAALSTYLAEFHCSKYRSKVQLVRGTMISCGTLVLPFLAWAILPQEININLFNTNSVLYSWNIFLLVCATPSLLGGIIFIFLPESPKYLMSVGRNEEALEIFRKVYRLNTGKNKEEFPIKSLVDELKIEESGKKHSHAITANRTKTEALKQEFYQLRPLCFPPYLKQIILVCSLQAMIMLCFNTLRLWLPQIFQAVSDYEFVNQGNTSDLCTMLEVLSPTNSTNDLCYVNFSPTVYTNTIINGVGSILGYVLAAILINKMGKKLLLSTFAFFSGICSMTIYFSQTTLTVVILSSLFLAVGGVCGVVIVTIAIDTFPTSLRTIAISLLVTAGTAFSMIGNFVFPVLMSLGCAPPFFFVGAVMILCSLCVVLLPNTEMKALK